MPRFASDSDEKCGTRVREIVRLAMRQHRIVARRQLLAMGFSGSAIDRLVRTGFLHVVFRGVYVVGTPGAHGRSLLMAAVLACGKRAVGSHLHAASLWDVLDTSSRWIHVTRPGKTTRKLAGIRLHEVRSLHPDDTAVIDNIPVTSLARTLLDVAAAAPRRLTHAWDEAERLGKLDLRAVEAAIARNPRHPGRRAVERLIARAELPPDVRSKLEQLAWDLILVEQSPRPEANVVVAGYTVDLLFPNGLVVELDGRTHHERRANFEADRERDADLLAAGHPVYRITWEAITERRPRVAARLRALAQPGLTIRP